MDPTQQLIRDLDDPTKFRRVERVAVFQPHEREIVGSDGKKRTIKVTADDLKQIAKNTNEVYNRSGRPVRLTLGHIKQDPEYPEHLQPKLVGFAKDFKAELVQRPAGTLLTVTQVEYLRADQADELLRQYPFRSPEYDPAAKVFGGVALLTRDPWLDNGAVYVYGGESKFVHYQAGDDMNDDDKFTPEEEAMYAKVCRYMKGKFPKLASYMDDTATEEDDEDDKPADYQKTGENTALYARLAAIEAERASERKALTIERCGRLLDQIRTQVKFNYDRELNTLASLPDDKAREEHVLYMLENNQKLPTVNYAFIPTAGPIQKQDDKNRPMTREEMNKAIDYATTKGLPVMQVYQDMRAGKIPA